MNCGEIILFRVNSKFEEIIPATINKFSCGRGTRQIMYSCTSYVLRGVTKPQAGKIILVLAAIYLWMPGILLSGQENLKTIYFENQPLSEVLTWAAREYGIKLAFDHDLAHGIRINLQLNEATMETALSLALQNTPLGYMKVHGVYIIKPRDELPPVPEEKIIPKSEINISGLVREAGTNEYLPYAGIVIEGTLRGTSTNSDGYFTLMNLYADSIPIVISYIGYFPVRYVYHPEKSPGFLVIEMEKQPGELGIVEIIGYAHRDIIQSTTIPGRLAMNAGRMQEVPSLNSLDVATPLQMLPGIDGTTENASGLSIRKSPSDKNLILYDGFTIYHIDHFFGMFTAFNSKAIKDIRIHKGGYDASYGGRAGGVIEITGKTGDMGGVSANAGIDMLSGNLFLESPLGRKASVVLTGRRSFTDLIRSPLYHALFNKISYDVENRGNRAPGFMEAGPDQSTYYFYDYTAKFSLKPTQRDVISLSTYRGFDRMDYGEVTERAISNEESDWGNRGGSVRWARKWSDRFYNNLLLGYSDYHLQFLHTDSLSRTQLNPQRSVMVTRQFGMNNTVSDLVFQFNNEWQITARNNLGFGMATNVLNTEFDDIYRYFSNQVALSDTVTREKSDNNLNAFYLQHNYSHGRISMFNLGLRVSRYNNETWSEPRVSAGIRVFPGFDLKASFGLHKQFINRILLIEGGQFRFLWALSDGQRLPVVASRQTSAGFLWKPIPSLSVDAEFYIRNSEGMIAVQNRLVRGGTGNTLQWRRIYYPYSNLTKGMDLLVRKSFGNLESWLAYTLSSSMDVSAAVNNGQDFPAFNDQRHEIKLLGVYTKNDWSVSSSWILGSGKPWDKPYFANGLQLHPDYNKNGERLPVYHRLDLGMGKLIRFNSSWLNLGFNIFNLYNQTNVISRPYSLSEEPFRDVMQGRSPLIFNEIMGRGFALNIFADFRF